MKMKYTKAQMIEKLNNECRGINTLPFYIVESKEFFEHQELCVSRIKEVLGERKLIVRSSCTNEDTDKESNAGKYTSILNVNPTNQEMIQAIEQVYASYQSNQNEQILIQPMLTDIIKSGVAFTRDIYTLAPYYVVNYMEGEDTAAITSGISENAKTFIVYRETEYVKDPDMQKLVKSLKILEKFLEEDALDVEFAITKTHEVYIFQVRPITRKANETNLHSTLLRINKKVEKLMRPHPFLVGNTTYFGVMPDWNPAEILGVRPQKLAISLYKELITDNVWAHQRTDYGYRDLTMHPLMVSFCGIPYIDTRITFNSFIPAALNENIAEKLVNYYLQQLKACPAYHDKIEFEIVFSCYYLGLPEELHKLVGFGFNENEIKRIEYALLDLTNRVIHPEYGLYKKDIKKIDILIENHQKIVESDISLVDKIYWLIEECKTYGTLPFAGVARAAFIAVQFLKSFIKTGIITEEEYNCYMGSMNTVSKQLKEDKEKYFLGEIQKAELIKKYGHIRPGTYDILSPRYDEAFDYYFGGEASKHSGAEIKFQFTKEQMRQIDVELEQNGIQVKSSELFVFIREAIEGREYLKFVFTKSISEILKLIGELGERTSITKEDMAHLDISVIKQLYVDLYFGNVADILKSNIEVNKKQYQVARIVKLPSLIVSPEDVYQFYLLDEEPNYITLNSVTGEVVLEEDIGSTDIEGKIVFIKSADPGYDFIFSKNIGGLVTQFGGSNSHMAIRCAELGIPAIIGSGEKKYSEWSKERTLIIDCMKKKVERYE